MIDLEDEVFSLRQENKRLHQRVKELEKSLTESAVEILRLKKDIPAYAERYRWLREQHWNYSDLVVVTRPRQNVKLGSDCPCADRLDAAIDAAMESK